MPSLTKLDISELMTTRISHDLIGNVGAVANAVELLEEGDLDFLEDIKSILKTSSGVMSRRMKFFRLAFGLNNANLQDTRLVTQTCREYLLTIGNQNFPIELELGSYNPQKARLVMVGVMMLADMLIKGGKIIIAEEGGKLYFKISGVSRLSEDKQTATVAILSGQSPEPQATQAPVFYFHQLLAENNWHCREDETATFGLIIE